MTFHDAAARPVLALPGFRLDLTSDDTAVRAIRTAIGEHIERLLQLLDLIDGDPEAEDGGDVEMSLGWQDEGSQIQLRASHDDREHEHDGREDIYR